VKWRALFVLSMAQFLMVLDQAVMNVSISQLVEDFDTSVTVIQAIITFYALTMAALMITGGKLGDRWGRRRAFVIGLIVYGAGSALTAAAPTVAALLIGWSILEGVGAALVLPAMVAMIAGSYQGADRAVAYGVIGGVAGAGIAVGPILGGWVTTSFTWRYVFVGEVILAAVVIVATRLVGEPPQSDEQVQVDWVGAGLSSLGLGLAVFGILQTSEWGWLADAASPIAPFGLSLAPFVIGAGMVIFALFVRWSEFRERRGQDALVRLGLMEIRAMAGGLQMLALQNTILMGVFFAIPLYLQVVLGFDALDTGIRMLPVSMAMFITSFVGARFSRVWSPYQIVRAGLLILLVGVFVLMATIQPSLRGIGFGTAMTLLGVGMGLLASQLGNVVQSSVTNRDRSEAGGLQYTAQQLGSALGTALVGAIVITALGSAFISKIALDPRVPEDLTAAIEVELAGNVPFVPTAVAGIALEEAGVDPLVTSAIIESYEESQLGSLRIGLLVVTALIITSLFLARRIPDTPLAELATGPGVPGA